ncbi:MAG: thioredoxin family protein, partial [Pirellulaceae bacterium]|nr:thioredoxin family protein [Pirellulaceae bacterium]
MNTESTNTPKTESDAVPPDQCGPTCGRSGRWFWLFAILFIALLQWPAIKELYYQVSGTEFPEQTIPWKHDLASALTLASTQEKPVLAVFGATWCPPCRTMKREVWPDPQVSAAVEAGFVPLYVDVDDQSQAELVSRYGVQGIPTILLLDSQGKVLQERNVMSVSETLS